MSTQEGVVIFVSLLGFLIAGLGMALIKKNLIRIFGTKVGEGIFDLILGIAILIGGIKVLTIAFSG